MVEDISVTYTRLYHPQGVTGYRLERDGVVLVVATDVEHGDSDSDRAVRELAANADVLIYDAQYHPQRASREQDSDGDTAPGRPRSTWPAMPQWSV